MQYLMMLLWRKQYNFIQCRFIRGEKCVISTKISRNNYNLPSMSAKIQVESPQIKITRTVMKKLQSSCVHKEQQAVELFKTEFTGVPECLVKDGLPYHSIKAIFYLQ